LSKVHSKQAARKRLESKVKEYKNGLRPGFPGQNMKGILHDQMARDHELRASVEAQAGRGTFDRLLAIV
jgi:hypothetical protein